MHKGGIFGLLKETFTSWSEDRATRLAAALAYYTIFSIAPLLIILIAVVGLVFGRQAVQGQIVGQIQGVVGQQGADLIQAMIQNASRPSSSIPATIIGVVTLLLGAMGVFGQLQDSLNTIWEVKPKPGRGALGLLKDRLASFAMVLVIGFLLLVFLVISAALAAASQMTGFALRNASAIQIVNFVFTFAVITLLFALIFKVLPDIVISWSDVWIGAAATALLFSVGRLLLGLYLGRSSTTSAYGAAGSLVVILLWVYYSAQILFLGAEFTQVYARRYGAQIRPRANAVPLTATERANQGVTGSKLAAPRDVSPVGRGGTEVESGRSAGPTAGEDGTPLQRGRWLYGPALAGVLLGIVAGFAGEIGAGDKRK